MADAPPELTSLLHALADGHRHSGERLAEAAGCSRAALAKRIARLQARFGLAVEAQVGRGYQLAAPLDLLDTNAISEALGARAQVHVHTEVDSTNRWLADATDARDPQLCLAETQTAGRGRRGRDWASPLAMSLYLSLSWRFEHPASGLGALPLAMGVATADALDALGAGDIGIKWPNDLICDDGKLGGLLCEARGEMGGSFRVIIGLGLNVHDHDGLQTLDQPATALAAQMTQPPPSRTAIAITVGGALLDACACFNAEGFAPFATGFAARDRLRDRAVTVYADTPWQGIARGVDGGGALRVATADGTLCSVHAGDVSVRRA